jgi:hypothetical protein
MRAERREQTWFPFFASMKVLPLEKRRQESAAYTGRRLIDGCRNIGITANIHMRGNTIALNFDRAIAIPMIYTMVGRYILCCSTVERVVPSLRRQSGNPCSKQRREYVHCCEFLNAFHNFLRL